MTIVAANRKCLFGSVSDDQMHRNALGDIAAAEWVAIATRFPSVMVADFVVMPNHLHGTLTLTDDTVSLSAIIGAYKSGVTRRINSERQTDGHPVWQRSYHERINRSEQEFGRIQEYIANNPLRWALDEENGGK